MLVLVAQGIRQPGVCVHFSVRGSTCDLVWTYEQTLDCVKCKNMRLSMRMDMRERMGGCICQ